MYVKIKYCHYTSHIRTHVADLSWRQYDTLD